MLTWEKGNTPRKTPYQCQFFHHKCHIKECRIIRFDPVTDRLANNQDDEKPVTDRLANNQDDEKPVTDRLANNQDEERPCYLPVSFYTASKFFASTTLQSLRSLSLFHSTIFFCSLTRLLLRTVLRSSKLSRSKL